MLKKISFKEDVCVNASSSDRYKCRGMALCSLMPPRRRGKHIPPEWFWFILLIVSWLFAVEVEVRRIWSNFSRCCTGRKITTQVVKKKSCG